MTGDESYHAHCFTCRTCKRRIEELVFAKTSQGIYCMVSFDKAESEERSDFSSPVITSALLAVAGMPRPNDNARRARSARRKNPSRAAANVRAVACARVRRQRVSTF